MKLLGRAPSGCVICLGDSGTHIKRITDNLQFSLEGSVFVRLGGDGQTIQVWGCCTVLADMFIRHAMVAKLVRGNPWEKGNDGAGGDPFAEYDFCFHDVFFGWIFVWW